MEQKQTRNVYLWLWLSFFLTIPTLFFITLNIPIYTLSKQYCGEYSRQCFAAIENLVMLSAVLISGMWHLILLVYLLPRRHPFVRGHAAQGLFLAGTRTLLAVIAISLNFLPDYKGEIPSTFVLILMILAWLVGNVIETGQVRAGRCTLLNLLRVKFTLTPLPPTESDIRQRVQILRFSTNPRKRANALEKLNQWGMVEHTQPVETID